MNTAATPFLIGKKTRKDGRTVPLSSKSNSQIDTSGGIIRGEKNPVKEGKGYVEERKEVRTDFARRCASEGFTVQHSKAERAGEAAAYGYRDIHIQGASAAGTVRKGLSGLGIPSFAMDGALWINWSGVSRLLEISEASAIPGEGVFINAETTVSPMEIIGHEAFHFWKGTKARDAYIEILQDNLNFSSLAFMEYQRTFQRFYFDEAVDLFDAKQMELFQEELFAYISGDLYEGTRDAKIAPMFRDFEAVKAAWKTLVAESQMGSGALKGAEEEGDMGGQPYPDDDPLVREIWRLSRRDAVSDSTEGQPYQSSDPLLQAMLELQRTVGLGETSVAAERISRKSGRLKLSKREWRQVQSAQVQKYAGMDEGSIPETGYVFAHDRFYLIRNYGLGMFDVAVRLDPAKKQRTINRIMEEYDRGNDR